ncbi:hypothetical protein LXA43DRAFT_1061551 [Ganoderma leucocontextum]|nr:hypothetical protein LXA43DRAFT_1061551 [Ganoderma leucocontextum]
MSGTRPLYASTQSVSKIISARIPFDVACAILDEVSYQGYPHATLHACSLVCRDWTSTAQRHLFRSVGIHLDRYRGPNPEKRKGRSWNPLDLPRRFLDILDGSPHLASFVLSVTIHSGSIPFSTFLRAMLSKTTCLRKLRFVDIMLRPGPEAVLDAPSFDRDSDAPPSPGPRAAIDQLDLSRCTFDGTRPLLDLLHSFSRIRHLNLHFPNLMSGDDDNDVLDSIGMRPSAVPAIESATLSFLGHDGNSDGLLTFLHSALCASSLPAGALKSIRFRVVDPSGLDRFLLPCLRDACAVLRELHLDADFRDLRRGHLRRQNLSERWSALGRSLASCIALESLTFVVKGQPGPYNRHRGDAPYADYLRAVLPAYARCVCPPPPSVRSIVFRVRQSVRKDEVVRDVLDAITSPGEQEQGHWGRLDAALSAHGDSLARFAFVFDSDNVTRGGDEDGCVTEQDRARIAAALGGVLPKMAAKGVLRVELNSSRDVYSF